MSVCSDNYNENTLPILTSLFDDVVRRTEPPFPNSRTVTVVVLIALTYQNDNPNSAVDNDKLVIFLLYFYQMFCFIFTVLCNLHLCFKKMIEIEISN